jgi:hypothetical protein
MITFRNFMEARPRGQLMAAVLVVNFLIWLALFAIFL